MRLGLGLGLGAQRRPAAPTPPPAFDPTDWSSCTLDLDAEAGTSQVGNLFTWASQVGSVTFTNGSNTARTPSAGADIGTHATLSFDGSSDYLASASQPGAIISAAGWSIYLVLRVKAYAVATTFTGTIGGGYIFGDNGDYWGLTTRSNNSGQVCGAAYTAGSYKTVAITHPVDEALVLVYRGDNSGSAHLLSVNDGAPVSASGGGAIATNGGAMQIGKLLNATYGQFELARLVAYNTLRDSTTHAEVVAALMATYGL